MHLGRSKILHGIIILVAMGCMAGSLLANWPVIDVPNLTARTLQRIEDVNKTNQEAKQTGQENQKQSSSSAWMSQVGPPVQGQDTNPFSPAPISDSEKGVISSQLSVNKSSAQTLPDGSIDDPYSTYLASTVQWRNEMEVLRAKLNQLILMEDASANDFSTWIGIENEMSVLGTEINTSIAAENDAAALAKQKLMIQVTEKRAKQSADNRDNNLLRDTAP